MSKNTSRTEQSDKFIRKARELGCDEDPKAFERALKAITKPRATTARKPEEHTKREEG